MDATNTPTLAFADIDYSLIVYILGALLIGGGGAYYIMITERMVTAIGFLLASIAIFVYFGLRWFDGFKLRQGMSGVINPNTPWPPIINYCPDFMNIVKDGTDYYCVDTTGISTLPRYNATTGLVKTGTLNYIPLRSTNTPMTYVSGNLLSAGVTWEGVWDGRSASAARIPYPA
jgi:hypothetical protein